ncbi:unnamed protein product [Penicillium salamii]|nr:unnamed protein product [Penicillium salamii]CAG8423204.1 unnamed protein product [Penicillium salamii]
MWVIIIAGLASAALGVFLFPETYPPVLLEKKLRRLQLQSATPMSPVSQKGNIRISTLLLQFLGRPLRLFTTQPILVLLTIYQSFIYGVLFLFYQSYPISFGEDRGWKGGLVSLPLIGVVIGVLIGTVGVFVFNETYFRHHCYSPAGEFIPESRLPLMILGGSLIPAGMFWFAWTSNPHVPWPSQVCASLLIGCGMYLLFLQCFTYIVDCYTSVANSAMGVNGAMRSVFGAAFPLFARPMFHGLGVNWVMTVIAFISLALVPVPICFWYLGARVRSWSSAKI